METETVAHFQLRTGETLNGRVRWWDLGAFGLETEPETEIEDEGSLIIVQRHAVVDWEDSPTVAG